MAIGTPSSLGTPVASAVTATTRTFTTSVAAPSDSLIIAVCFWGAVASQSGVMSGGGLTWGLTGTGTPEQTNAWAFSGFTFSAGIFSAPAAAGLAGSSVLTLTSSAGVDAQIAVYAVTGMDLTSSRKDVSNGQGALTANWDSGSATNTVPDVLLIGGSMADGSAFGGVMSSTPAAGVTELDDVVNSGDDWAFTTAYQIVSAIASQKLSGTWAASANQVSDFVAYKGAAAAGATVSDPGPRQSILTLPFMVSFPNAPMTFLPQGVSAAPLDLTVDESGNGIPSAEAFGNSTVTIAQTVSPTGIGSAETFGSDRVDLSIAATGITSAEAFGSARVDLSILGTGIASAETFGSQTVTVPASGQTVDTTGNSIASAEVFGSDRVDLGLAGTGIASAEAFGADQVNLALTGVGIGSAETFGSDRIDLSILGAGIPSAETFGSTDRIDQSILGVGIASREAFGPAVVTGGTVGTGSGGDLATRGYGT